MFEILLYLFVASIATATVGIGSWMSTVEADPHQGDDGPESRQTNSETYQNITVSQALAFPLYSSFSLLILFFFFSYVQFVLVLFLLVGASFSVYQVFEAIFCNFCKNKMSPLVNTVFPYFNALFTLFIGLEWLRSGNIVCHDILGCSLSILFIATMRFPSLRIASICLLLLIVYDMFWVYFSEYFFTENVMVSVATKQATNPVHQIAVTLNVDSILKFSSNVDLPIKLIFSNVWTGNMIMLGLGDIALPGALVSLALRCDKTEEKNAKLYLLQKDVEAVRNFSPNLQSTLFFTSMAAYFLSLLLAFGVNRLSGHAQPALIYLVPCVLGAVSIRAYYHGRLTDMWNGKYRLELSR